MSLGPGIFQKEMEEIFEGISGVATILDDIVVTGKNDKEHLEN